MSTAIQVEEKQPKALYLLFFVQMWECFSYYGMRALLVLYIINKLGFSDLSAYGIYALYCSLSEMGGIVGGYLADKFLGLRFSIALGGWIMALGHACMAVEGWENSFFYLGLSLIIVGSCLFSTNISALLGLYYDKEEDPRVEKGFTLFYVGINIGALLASILCGVVGEVYGWHYGFGLAAFGMLLGNIALFAFRGVLEDKGYRPSTSATTGRFLSYLGILAAIPLCILVLHMEDQVLTLLPFVCVGCFGFIGWKMFQSKLFPVKQLVTLSVVLVCIAFFYSAEEQVGSSLIVFSERFADRAVWGFEIPNTVLLAFNPLTIILGGALMSRILRHANKDRMVLRMAGGIFLAGLVFAGIVAFCYFPSSEGQVSILVILSGIVMVSVAELLIGPTAYAYCSEIAPPSWKGVIMGLVPLGFALAEVIGGFWSKAMAFEENADIEPTLELYRNGFGNIALGLMAVSAIVALIVFLMNRREQRTEALA